MPAKKTIKAKEDFKKEAPKKSRKRKAKTPAKTHETPTIFRRGGGCWGTGRGGMGW